MTTVSLLTDALQSNKNGEYVSTGNGNSMLNLPSQVTVEEYRS